MAILREDKGLNSIATSCTGFSKKKCAIYKEKRGKEKEISRVNVISHLFC